MTTQAYEDDIIIAPASSGGFDMDVVDEDTYTAVISKIEQYTGTKYQSTDPQEKLAIYFTIQGGDFDGSVVRRAGVNLTLGSEAKESNLGKIVVAATGAKPTEAKVPLRALLIGKKVKIVVENKTGDYGEKSYVTTILAPPKKKAAVAPVADDLDDDLQDA